MKTNIAENAGLAMNTIPSTFSEYEINRTVLWGRQQNKNVSMDISVIMLNKSGSHLKTQTLEILLSCGFKSIVLVEPDSQNYNIDEISRRYPTVKFVIPLEKASDGTLINSCISEIDSKYFFVIRDSMYIPQGFLLKNLAENILKSDVYCVVPRLVDITGSGISTNFVPEARKGKFKLSLSPYVQDNLPTLYPFDFIGIYNREKFINLGGFDYTLTSNYWQNADLALRSWLWGEKTIITTKFQIAYAEEIPVEDSKPDLSYLRFYLKNVLPKFKSDHGVISRFSFFGYYLCSSCGLLESVSQFKMARRWVRKNQFRFKKDIQYLIEHWVTNNER